MPSRSEVIVVGAGGHAKVVIGSLYSMGCRVHAIYDDNPEKWGQRLVGLPICGPIDRLGESDGFPAVLAIGDPMLRIELAKKYARQWFTVIHSKAHVDAAASVGDGSVIFAGAVIQPDVVIGMHAIINTSSSVDHDCHLNDFVHVAPGAHLAANVTMERASDLGTGASVIPGIRIGEHAIIGAGAAVVRDIPAYATAVGCPARVIKIRQSLE